MPTEHISDIEKRYLDKVFEASVALWSALLTVNGITVSAFSILTLVVNRLDCVLSLLIGACLLSALVSLWVLLLNFGAAKNVYERIGVVLSGNPDDLTEEQRQKDINDALEKRKWINRRELAAKLLFVMQVFLLLSIFVRQQLLEP